jgi:glycosyltransferase involved in cell wall biosynthesis
MAAHHDVTVLCADGAPGHPYSYRNAVTDYFTAHGEIPGLRVAYVGHPPKTLRCAQLNRCLMKLAKGFGWQFLYYMGLNAWHMAVYQKAYELGFENFDVVHQLTPISFLRPGYLSYCKRPFFWGPIGGMYQVPRGFNCLGGAKARLFERVRSANINKCIRMSRFRRLVKRTVRIWTITEEERRIIEALAPGKAALMIETSPPADIQGHVRIFDRKRLLQLCWSGQHEARKALPLLLEAMAQLPDPKRVRLTVLGEGPETLKWQALADYLCLSTVEWRGRLPYSKALQVMGQGDIFVHSSYREGTPHVVLEALGWGMPVICHDACGMAVAVNEDCGIKVPFETPARSIAGFREAILNLLQKPWRVQQLSEGALRRAEALSWNAKVNEMAEAYVRHAMPN